MLPLDEEAQGVAEGLGRPCTPRRTRTAGGPAPSAPTVPTIDQVTRLSALVLTATTVRIVSQAKNLHDPKRLDIDDMRRSQSSVSDLSQTPERIAGRYRRHYLTSGDTILTWTTVAVL